MDLGQGTWQSDLVLYFSEKSRFPLNLDPNKGPIRMLWPYDNHCNPDVHPLPYLKLPLGANLQFKLTAQGNPTFKLITRSMFQRENKQIGMGALKMLVRPSEFFQVPKKTYKPAQPIQATQPPQPSVAPLKQQRCDKEVKDRLVTCQVGLGECNISGCDNDADCDRGFRGRSCEYQLTTGVEWGTYYCDTEDQYNYSLDRKEVVKNICESIK